jgi:hypothetical protein
MFTDYIDDRGMSYSIASWRGKPDNSRLCPANSCDIENCNPGWLCKASSAGSNATLGVSYRTAIPAAQYQTALDNGLLQAKLIHGSRVSSELELRTSANDQLSQQIMYSSSRSKLLSNKGFEHYAVTDSCIFDETLALRVELLDIKADKLTVESADWLQQPKLNGREGAVGSVERPMASGLFSDQLKLAVKRALVQLAREIQIDVSEESLYIQSDSGILTLSTTKETSHAVLKAQVLAFHFETVNNHQLTVHAWVERVAD